MLFGLQPVPPSRLMSNSLTIQLILRGLLMLASRSHHVYAVDSHSSEDHNHLLERALDVESVQDQAYVSEFPGYVDGLVPRAPSDDATALVGNTAKNLNIEIGDIDLWVFPKETLQDPKAPSTPGLPPLAGASWRTNLPVNTVLQDDDDEDESKSELRRRQTSQTRTLYISLNVCEQPTDKDSPDKIPPSLNVYVSKTPNNKQPGPGAPDDEQEVKAADHGFTSFTIEATDDTYIAVEAPKSAGFQDIYNYDIAASIDAPFHAYDATNTNIDLIDSDSNATLLMTSNLTRPEDQNTTIGKQWSEHAPPFILFAHPNDDPYTSSLQSSYCALKNYAAVASYSSGKNAENVNTSLTSTFLPPSIKQLFYVHGLNRSTSYSVSLAMQGNSTTEGGNVVGGGGKIWKPIELTTKAEESCRVIYNLSFCSSVAYSVPANPSIDVLNLAGMYDNNAAKLYKNFSNALSQVQCDTGPEARYSLVKTCDDCRKAYKSWLCAVTIPRCADYSSDVPSLVPRNLGASFFNGTTPTVPAGLDVRSSIAANSSRNPLIDQKIKPGPYKEMLPCKEHCWSMIQACPAKLQFACPTGTALNQSYGTGEPGIDCNSLDGLVTSGAERVFGGYGILMSGMVGLAVIYALV